LEAPAINHRYKAHHDNLLSYDVKMTSRISTNKGVTIVLE